MKVSMTLILALSVVALAMFVTNAYSSPVRSYNSVQKFDAKDRQEIISLAAHIIRVAMAGYSGNGVADKRNAGTVDTLYNLPDLSEAGRR